MLRITAALAVVAAVAGAPPAASADVRTGGGDDQRDAPFHENVNGSSYYEQDIARADMTYDTAGRLVIRVRFHDPVPASSSPNRLRVTVGAKYDPPTAYSSGYCFGFDRGDATVSAPPQTTTPNGSVTLSGIDGSIPFTGTIEDNGYTYAIDITHPALAGRGYQCFKVELGYSYENFHCTQYGCYDYSYHSTDETAAFPLGGPGGYNPPAPSPSPITAPPTSPAPPDTPAAATECDDNKDNDHDGRVDSGDRGCSSSDDSSESPFDIRTLTIDDARGYMIEAINDRFQLGWDEAQGQTLRRCRKLSRTRVLCSADWWAGDVGFHGPITIWYSAPYDRKKKRRFLEWNYAYNIVKTNYYCLDRRADGDPRYRGRSCTKRYRVR